MAVSKKQVLIIDNATTCAMRIKTLVNIHGALAQIVHWSDWQHVLQAQTLAKPCLVIIEETVPLSITDSVVDTFSDLPLFSLINSQPDANHWQFNKPVTPIVSSLSNFELMALLQPYWREDKPIDLPNVLLLDEMPETSFLISQSLSGANIPCRIADEVENAWLNDTDMVLVNVSNLAKRKSQLEKIKLANPAVGIMAYGSNDELTNIEFVQFALQQKLDSALSFAELKENWLARFYQVWRDKAEAKDQLLVTQEVEASLAKLLEKSLVMQVLFANSMDGVVSFTEQGEILKLNNGFCELVGGLKQQVTSSNVFDWLTLQAKQELESLLNSEHLVQQQVLDLQIQHEHKITIPVSAAINKINFHGQFVYVAVMRNNTSQQLQQKLLMQKNAQLTHRAKELKRQHQVSADLSRINERKRNAFMLHFTNYLNQNSPHQLANVEAKISNVSQYFRIQTRQEQSAKQVVTFAATLEQVLSNKREALQAAKIDVETHVSKFLQVVFDPQHLFKVLQELLSNAISFSPKNSRIELSQSLLSEQFVEVTIADMGIGILEHKQIQLFDLYESNTENCQQLATGLPLVKALLQVNGGEIYVDNHYRDTEVIGSVFTLKLPLQSP